MTVLFFPPLIVTGLVYPDNSCLINKRLFMFIKIYLITGFLISGEEYCFVYLCFLCYLLIIPGFRHPCFLPESRLKAHKPTSGFVQHSLSEIS
jgi:hypothetical protein